MKLFIFCGIQHSKNLRVLDSYLKDQQQMNYLGQSDDIHNLFTEVYSRASSNNEAQGTSLTSTGIYTGSLETLMQMIDMKEKGSNVDIRLICFYSSPEFAVVDFDRECTKDSLNNSDSGFKLHRIWLESHHKRLELAFGQVSTLLVNELNVLNDLTVFSALVSEKTGLEFSVPDDLASPYKASELIDLTMELFEIQDHSELQQLFEQLESAAELLNHDFDPSISARLKTYRIMIDNVQSEEAVKQNSERIKLDGLTIRVSSLDSENEHAMLQIHQLQEQLEQHYLSSELKEKELESIVSKLTKDNREIMVADEAMVVELETLKSNLLNLESEKELALLQVLQLQEELEQTFLRSKALESEKNGFVDNISKLELENGQLQEELTFSRKNQEARETMISDKKKKLMDQLVVSNEKVESLLKDLEQHKLVAVEAKSENELALLQVHQLQEELEQSFLRLQSFENERNKDNQHKSDVQHQELVSQIEKVTKAADLKESELAKTITDLELDNELALLQIHQLQEELEYYYLKYKQDSNWTPISVATEQSPQYLQKTLQLLKR